ncbi:MAG: LPS export ABC transporter periplasmic protein LptC [Candidatus Omnitrophica bacterium]|nr:LPS export ABC transporter periplasmic protein LptC [Candidatus Omnitrophota bacterium]MBU1047597.1 LPS export ABC transporter periplasmic protein LptC [Candidatus Omnitrophota bacterium]MBU1888959.1 LPS export ABC transporter periplasmic protein LptC [Candidatus Omnitrophota bacterium]
MDGEIIKWELEADSAQFDENAKTLKGVKVKFYPQDKDPFTIKADDGVVKENVLVENLTVGEAEKKDEIYLKNNVQIIGYLNSNIKCDSLSWDSISETMHTQDKVEIEAEKWNINGEGIEFSPSGDIMTINKDVTMQIN